MLPTVRAQPTTFSPCWTNARATAAPMPPEAPVTSASRSRHRSMPGVVMVPSRLPTSFGEPGTGIAGLRPESQRLGCSVVFVGACAGIQQKSEQRLDPPPCGPALGRGSALGTSALGNIARGHRRCLAALCLERPPLPATPPHEPVPPATGGNRSVSEGPPAGAGRSLTACVVFLVSASICCGDRQPRGKGRTHSRPPLLNQSPFQRPGQDEGPQGCSSALANHW